MTTLSNNLQHQNNWQRLHRISPVQQKLLRKLLSLTHLIISLNL